MLFGQCGFVHKKHIILTSMNVYIMSRIDCWFEIPPRPIYIVLLEFIFALISWTLGLKNIMFTLKTKSWNFVLSRWWLFMNSWANSRFHELLSIQSWSYLAFINTLICFCHNFQTKAVYLNRPPLSTCWTRVCVCVCGTSKGSDSRSNHNSINRSKFLQSFFPFLKSAGNSPEFPFAVRICREKKTDSTTPSRSGHKLWARSEDGGRSVSMVLDRKVCLAWTTRKNCTCGNCSLCFRNQLARELFFNVLFRSSEVHRRMGVDCCVTFTELRLNRA